MKILILATAPSTVWPPNPVTKFRSAGSHTKISFPLTFLETCLRRRVDVYMLKAVSPHIVLPVNCPGGGRDEGPFQGGGTATTVIQKLTSVTQGHVGALPTS